MTAQPVATVRVPVLDVRTLTTDLPTRLGTYAAGQQVIVTKITGAGITICLDAGGFHPDHRCHSATVARDRLSPPALWRPNTRSTA